MKDPYKTLRINRAAGDEEIKAAYRRLIAKYAPDRNIGNDKAVERFKEVQAAYELLSDPARRNRFDETGATDEPRQGEEAAVLGLLATVCEAVLNRFIGRGMDLARIDLCAEIRNSLDSGRTRMRDEVRRLQRLQADLEIVASRFTVADGDGGDNIFRSVALKNLGIATTSLDQARAELAKIEKAIMHLTRLGYKVDTPQGEGVWSLTSMGIPHLLLEPKKGSEY